MQQVVAPEHPLSEALTSAAQRATVDAYVAAAALKSDLDRTELQKTKTGVFTGATLESLFTQARCSAASRNLDWGSSGSKHHVCTRGAVHAPPGGSVA